MLLTNAASIVNTSCYLSVRLLLHATFWCPQYAFYYKYRKMAIDVYVEVASKNCTCKTNFKDSLQRFEVLRWNIFHTSWLKCSREMVVNLHGKSFLHVIKAKQLCLSNQITHSWFFCARCSVVQNLFFLLESRICWTTRTSWKLEDQFPFSGYDGSWSSDHNSCQIG